MTPQRLAALCALIASDASQRATVVPWTPGGSLDAAAGYAEDAASVEALREIAAWLKGRRRAA